MIRGEAYPPYAKNGLPKYARLKKVLVAKKLPEYPDRGQVIRDAAAGIAPAAARDSARITETDLGPAYRAGKPLKISAIRPPTAGTNPIRIHHADLSTSCQRFAQIASAADDRESGDDHQNAAETATSLRVAEIRRHERHAAEHAKKHEYGDGESPVDAATDAAIGTENSNCPQFITDLPVER